LLLMTLGVVRLPSLYRHILSAGGATWRRWVQDPCVMSLVFCLWALFSWALHPSGMGLVLVGRLVGVAATVQFVSVLPQSRLKQLIRAIVWSAVFQALICVVQLVVRGPVGLSGLGESIDPFHYTANWKVPNGTSFYPYPLVAMGLVAIALVALHPEKLGRPLLFIGSISGGALLGMSGSLSGLLGAGVFLGIVLLATKKGTLRWAAFGAGFLLFLTSAVGMGVVQRSVWLWKHERTVEVEGGQATSGRYGQVKFGIELARNEPLVGVGPMRFQAARQDYVFSPPPTDVQISHSVPILILAELGVPGLITALAMFLAVVKRNPWAAAILLTGISGYVLGDIMHWYRGFGLFQLAVIFGLVAHRPSQSET
jgi:hypothetical protein